MSNFRFTEEQVQFVIEHGSSVGTLELTQMFNDHFKVNNKVTSIQNLKGRLGIKSPVNSGCFKKGITPWNKGLKGYIGANKTSFKKGTIPPNYKPIGTERFAKDGYIEVKVKDPNVWELKHRYIYKKHHGEIPNGYNVIFADKNISNFDIDNLILVSKAEMLILNKNKLIFEDKDFTKVGVNIAKLINKTKQ
jgi:hypothetical protein